MILVACGGFIRTDVELDNLTALGTGVMLWANIPIMLLCGLPGDACVSRVHPVPASGRIQDGRGERWQFVERLRAACLLGFGDADYSLNSSANRCCISAITAFQSPDSR